MAAIEIPKQLKRLLEDSNLQAPVKSLTDRAGEILADNKLAFFPDYTDHGLDHIECVLKSEVDLVPKQVWDDSKDDSEPRLLHDADAAVIIGATLLHDIAMHLRPTGFRELVGKDSRFQPLPWFRESHEDQSADLPWHEVWENYVREARRFSERDLTNIIGEASARDWKFERLPNDVGQWETNHYLVVGEFIRRHHARLAHEIAIYGFPGLPTGSGEGQFPAMGKEQGHVLMQLADLIGLVARSHGTSLRVCNLYLDASPLYPGTPKPMGTAVFYPMALLRVADYLQIDRPRAPAVLLQLRNPQSPVSVQEWKKHRAVQNIGPATDPRGKMITVSTDLSLPLYLQLRDLLAGLQAEMDHSTAVLDEVYGARTELGLNKLSLATRRVYSNLHSPIYRDSLPYVPNHTGFTADPNLLTLLVEPLYGKVPSVGVRELMQNAADAVCELEVWSETRNVPVQSLDLPDQDCDVLIEFIKRDNGSWLLRVRDRGIGMTADTIQNYFLRAGASFRRSSEWAKEFVDEQGHPSVIRAGRFGIGAFAVFLLGPSFRLWTRHAATDKSIGYTIAASANSQLIEISRVDGLKIGTTIEVELKDGAAKSLGLDEGKEYFGGPGRHTDWFCWDWPKIHKRIIRDGVIFAIEQEYSAPIRMSGPQNDWLDIYPSGFDVVHWTFDDAPPLSCNGLRIDSPPSYSYFFEQAAFNWPDDVQLLAPKIAVVDGDANLPVTTQRYGLSERNLPFIAELTRDVVLSFIAHALCCGPTSRDEALLSLRRHPLELGHASKYGQGDDDEEDPFARGRLRWCATSTALVPLDGWLHSLLQADSYLIFGVLDIDSIDAPEMSNSVLSGAPKNVAMFQWNGVYHLDDSRREEDLERASSWPATMLEHLINDGVAALKRNVKSSRVLVSTTRRFSFKYGGEMKSKSRNRESTGIWRKIERPTAGKLWLSAKSGSMKPSISLDAIVAELDKQTARDEPWGSQVVYAAEIKTEQQTCEPESPIARIWSECLGARAIPFDKSARNKLITEACKHPALKTHIVKWQNMIRDEFEWMRT